MKVDDLDVGKLKAVPIDLKELSKLTAKVNNLDKKFLL